MGLARFFAVSLHIFQIKASRLNIVSPCFPLKNNSQKRTPRKCSASGIRFCQNEKKEETLRV